MKTIFANTPFALLALSISSLATNTHAGRWSGDGRIGYNSVSGNSDNKSLSLGLDAAYKPENRLYTGETDAYSATRNGHG